MSPEAGDARDVAGGDLVSSIDPWMTQRHGRLRCHRRGAEYGIPDQSSRAQSQRIPRPAKGTFFDPRFGNSWTSRQTPFTIYIPAATGWPNCESLVTRV